MRKLSCRGLHAVLMAGLLLCAPAVLFAQQAEEDEGPPPLWVVSAGAGLALTGGNTDTSTINLSYEVVKDGGLPVTFRSAGLYMRGKTDDTLNVDKAFLDNRVDRHLNERLSAFGQVGYLRDRFKEIDYLLSPTAGLSYAFVKNARFELTGDGGVGVIMEKNTGLDLDTDGSILGGQRFLFNLSDAARITQGVTALWKMNDVADGLYTFNVGLATAITTNSQLKIELLDTFQNQPPSLDVEKNDVSFLVSVVYKLTRE